MLIIHNIANDYTVKHSVKQAINTTQHSFVQTSKVKCDKWTLQSFTQKKQTDMPKVTLFSAAFMWIYNYNKWINLFLMSFIIIRLKLYA